MNNRSPDDLAPFMARMAPVIDATLKNLAAAEFRADPIGGVKYSRATSIISSAYKRHGQVLGRALLERLKDCERLRVWTEDGFKISNASAAELRRALPPAAYRDVQLPYGEQERSIPVDLMVHDTVARSLRSYNVKRGNGSYDAGKRRLILGELLRTQMLLSGYAGSLGLDATSAESYAVFYYGVRSVPEPFSLVAGDLDDHFAFPVVDAIEAVNDRLRAGLYRLIDG
jgi:hypothetical protein